MNDDNAALAHALNNPLLYVTLGLELIEREVLRLQQAKNPTPEDWARLRAILEDARDGAERLRTIVHDLARKGSERAAATATAAAAQRQRVLLIDDERHLGPTLSTGLREVADVVAVASGAEAVRLLLHDPAFDLILCDVQLPDLPGMDVYQQVIAQRPDLESRFVFITGGAVTDLAQDFLDARPAQRLDKPFRLEQVEALLRR